MLIESLQLREFEAGVLTDKPVRKKLFTSGRKEEDAPLPPPAPTFSEEELASAKRDAYQKGFLEGTKEGHAQAQNEHADIERRLTETLERFAVNTAPIFADYKKTVELLRSEMPKLALSIAKKVAGDALSRDAQAVVEASALHCVETMIDEPKITITVNESLAESLESKVKTLAQRLQAAGHITVQGDATMPIADYRTEWKNGSMERVTERLWQQIEHVIGEMLQNIARDTASQMDLLDVKIEETKLAPIEPPAEPEIPLSIPKE